MYMYMYQTKGSGDHFIHVQSCRTLEANLTNATCNKVYSGGSKNCFKSKFFHHTILSKGEVRGSCSQSHDVSGCVPFQDTAGCRSTNSRHHDMLPLPTARHETIVHSDITQLLVWCGFSIQCKRQCNCDGAEHVHVCSDSPSRLR